MAMSPREGAQRWELSLPFQCLALAPAAALYLSQGWAGLRREPPAGGLVSSQHGGCVCCHAHFTDGNTEARASVLLSHSRQELEPVPSPPPTPGWEGRVRGPGRRGSSRAACSWAVCREYAWARRAGGRDGVLVDTDFIWENRTRASPLESENLPCDPKSQSPQLGS